MSGNQILFGLSLSLISLLFWVVGRYLQKHPPKQINMFYGYRSKKAKTSIQHWNYAQNACSKAMRQTAKLLLGLVVLTVVVPESLDYTPYILGCIVLFLFLGYAWIVWQTERALTKEFKS